jgi:hypothetical protein
MNTMPDQSRFKVEDEVKVKATGAMGLIHEIHSGSGKNSVQFNRDFTTRLLFSDDGLELVLRREGLGGAAFAPKRSIM